MVPQAGHARALQRGADILRLTQDPLVVPRHIIGGSQGRQRGADGGGVLKRLLRVLVHQIACESNQIRRLGRHLVQQALVSLSKLLPVKV
ncbi:hypothetical protein SDC9_123860 [bioreactor metagenome]|uniref:Uncharacterized protein n=1 Tax=bioreactor metagenome TaxID=1076179 RepID=A0A645CIT4_9ZZZZ